MTAPLDQLVKGFADELKAVFSLPGTSSPEDQLKPPVSGLFKALGKEFDATVATKTEAHLSEEKVRPDIAVYVGGLVCGYVELKKPGLGADPAKLKGEHNKEQWSRLKNLPNLIYTDGRDWALYRGGERIGGTVRFDDDPTERGKKAVTADDAEKLSALIRDFLHWKPQVPTKPREFAAFIAPLARFLRSEVEHALKTPDSNVGLLAAEWRQVLFPDADDAQFADAYAQTVTYAMLLARLQGAIKLSPVEAAKTLDKNNGLLAKALELLGQDGAREELQVGFELLRRVLEALDPAEFLKTKPDLWLYFYEDFLAAYDPKLRKDYGVYYTPREVVELQVRLASELLEKRFDKKLGFADDGVVFLDPAAGTGTYLVATIKQALEKVRTRSGEGAVAERAVQMAENMYGFEILVGPYAVSHLRLTQALEGAGAKLKNRLNVFLADTLESPDAKPPVLTLTYKALTQEHEAARKVKRDGDILVCLGNPPYDRERRADDGTKQNKGGWVRFGDKIEGGAKSERQGLRPIFEDFLDPAREAGRGLNLQVIFNDYVYFWRWALWRLFEQQKCGGIVTFITASSYLAGPGFVGMREVMRRTFDELWIIDLGGDNLGARKTPNVFAIQIPVAIAIGVRSKKPKLQSPAKVRYAKIATETREEKLAALDAIADLKSIVWQDCPDAWQAPFLPVGKGAFFDWPKVTDLFPYHTAGSVFYRSWPIGETAKVLQARWTTLQQSTKAERKQLFKESRDRKCDFTVGSTDLPGHGEPPICNLTSDSHEPNRIRYGFRSFDRHYAYYDFRLGDFIRPALYRLVGENQIFLICPDSLICGEGPIAAISANLPDQHSFRGSFGGKDVIPLYRDAEATQANVAGGLLDCLAEAYDFAVTVEDLTAYVYALLGGQSYTKRFWNELETPGPRVPVTKDGEAFKAVAKLGRRLIWLHTYAERFRDKAQGDEVPTGGAKCLKSVPSDPAKYPEKCGYIPVSREVHIGEGRFGPVAPEVWEFEVSGLKVVQSWLGYRMKVRAGKKSSPLDDIRPERWTPRMTEEFLELLWVLEATLAMEPDLSAALDRVTKDECFKASELPTPTDAERKPPKVKAASGEQNDLFGDDGEDD
jgi:hypothetical protein